MKMKTTAFRASIYKVLDRIEKTGEPVEIERKGSLFRVIPVSKSSKLERLKRREIMKVDAESLVHSDWSREWNNDLP